MPLFIAYASYSNAGINGIVEKPADRIEAIRTVVDKAGGKLLAAYITTGQHDVVLITEQPDESDVVAIGMVATASGALAKIETVRAWRPGHLQAGADACLFQSELSPATAIALLIREDRWRAICPKRAQPG